MTMVTQCLCLHFALESTLNLVISLETFTPVHTGILQLGRKIRGDAVLSLMEYSAIMLSHKEEYIKKPPMKSVMYLSCQL